MFVKLRLVDHTAAPIIVIAAIVVVMLSLHTERKPKFIYNASASVPIGFYWIEFRRPKLGELVIIRPWFPLAKLMEEHKILPANALLLKTVAARTGDEICRVGTMLILNGQPSVQVRDRDANGSPLPGWEGCRKLIAGELFLLQPNPNSFDSRYFGPVSDRKVVGVAKPIWTSTVE